MLIYPQGLLDGERLAECSDEAKLHFPRLAALANGFGRVKLSEKLILESAYSGFRRQPTREELTQWLEEYKTHYLLLIYTALDGTLWGQWCGVPENALPRYMTKTDRQSPVPPAGSVEAFNAAYVERKRQRSEASGDFLKISESFGNTSDIPETFKTFPPVVVVVGGVVDVEGEEEGHKQKHAPSASVLSSEKSEFLQAWNENCGSLPKASKLSKVRTQKLAVRVREGLSVEQFTQAVQIAQRTPFLRGHNDRKWKCTFDFLIASEENLLKVLEMTYGEPDKPKAEFVEVPLDQWLGPEGKI